MTRSHDVDTLRELVSHRYVVEILDALSGGPRCASELSAVVHTRRGLGHALRVLASQALISTERDGSWDVPVTGIDSVRLTRRGQRIVEALSSIEMWTALFEQSAAANDI
ncbi:DNA-binding transcriptional ArsR family regulator [Nocardia transvalensis]|uniref:DNA-binding transcriptional ArsR family regulator n=1 Tax=Nocardia transvalensis TaxID=37333 RepID=A0A7W9UKR2_9NOCA|nr:helix-turn-helix domain-containing protein [Nocardia transvalensis]MBB5916756.1 DNA-binding transcriptional ArsR family regulator [Nocardia transvalensis]